MRIEGRSGGYGGGNDIPAGSLSFRTVKVTRYLCGSCGFSEEWIDAPEDLHKLKEKYGSSKSTAAEPDAATDGFRLRFAAPTAAAELGVMPSSFGKQQNDQHLDMLDA